MTNIIQNVAKRSRTSSLQSFPSYRSAIDIFFGGIPPSVISLDNVPLWVCILTLKHEQKLDCCVTNLFPDILSP
jgi:hypothetical protein